MLNVSHFMLYSVYVTGEFIRASLVEQVEYDNVESLRLVEYMIDSLT